MSDKAIALLAYYLAIAVATMVMLKCDIKITNWKYWAIIGCIIMSHIAGNSY